LGRAPWGREDLAASTLASGLMSKIKLIRPTVSNTSSTFQITKMGKGKETGTRKKKKKLDEEYIVSKHVKKGT
jgi:hypothetical protein